MLEDGEPYNNVYPRPGFAHIVRAQYQHDPYLTEVKQPISGTNSFLGRTIHFSTGLINDGLLDLSAATGIRLQTDVHRYNNNTLGAVVWSNNYSVGFGTSDKVETNVLSIDNITRDLKG
jgi:hypothetical protein